MPDTIKPLFPTYDCALRWKVSGAVRYADKAKVLYLLNHRLITAS
jgi:hypothetical protein